MDDKKGNFPCNMTEQEMDMGECSSEGEDEGEGDDEEEDDEELEEIDSDDDEESEEEIIDEEDDPVDSGSLMSTNFNDNSSSHLSVSTPTYEPSSPGI